MSRNKKNRTSLIDTFGHANRHWHETLYARTLENREDGKKDRNWEKSNHK